MAERNILNEARASSLIEDPRFGLGETWHDSAIAQALSRCALYEDAPFLSNAIRAFMRARTTSDEIDRFLKLWTAVNALRNHITVRFEAAQTAFLHVKRNKLPKRYRIQTMDYASLGAFASLIDPAHSLPSLASLRTPVFRAAQCTLGDLAERLVSECNQNPRGVLAQLTVDPNTSTSAKPHPHGAKAATATEELFALAGGLGLSPLVFMMAVVAYELRNGLIHGSIPMPLFPNEQREGLKALSLCSLVLDAFLDEALPQAVRQLNGGDGRMAPFPESYRQTIAQYLDRRFDGHGIAAKLRKYGLV